MLTRFIPGILAALSLLAACSRPSVVEVGPYTVTTIEKNVYHIQDANSAYPAGASVDAEGKGRYNNCSDMYLVVGRKEALLIDLSNAISWADNAAESLRTLVRERSGDRPLTITFTHNHGDHTGMIPAWVDDPEVHFALPEIDFERMAARFPEAQRSFYDEGEVFDLGGMKLETILVPGHTAGSMVFLLAGHDLLFSGDAVGSGSGVWLFNADGFEQYVSGVPHLLRALEELGVREDRLQIYGGHFHQNPKAAPLDMKYLRDMKVLCDKIEDGTAAFEPSGQRRGLETNFRYGDAVVTWSADQAEQYRAHHPEAFVRRDEDVVFRRIDDRTWVGNGHLVYNESVYLVEGDERALLIDAGAYMPRLDQAVAALTDKPVMMALTHGHGDHVGGIGCFPEVWLNPADAGMIGDYEGELKPLQDGEVIDLGGRRIEVLYTPGHTSGSVTFFDKDRRYGFSGDAFGSTNLLLFTTFGELVNTCTRTAGYMQKNGIDKLYPGHYSGDNPETLQRVLDEKTMAQEVLSGKRKGNPDSANGLNRSVSDFGVTIRYSDPDALK